MEILVLSIVIALLAIVAGIAYAARQWGIRIGLNQPTKAALSQLADANSQIAAKNRQLQDLTNELDRLTPLWARITRIQQQEKYIETVQMKIRRTEKELDVLEADIHERQVEIAAHPASASYNNLAEQVTALLNHKMGLNHSLVELRINLASAQAKLIEMADELAAKREQLQTN